MIAQMHGFKHLPKTACSDFGDDTVVTDYCACFPVSACCRSSVFLIMAYLLIGCCVEIYSAAGEKFLQGARIISDEAIDTCL